MYLIRAWILCPEKYRKQCEKNCKVRTKFTLVLKVFWLKIFYDYVEVVHYAKGGVTWKQKK